MVCSVKICHIPKTGNEWRRTYSTYGITVELFSDTAMQHYREKTIIKL